MTKRRAPQFGDREQRLRKAYERLGTDNPRCIMCPETNPLCLELHHPAQHAFAAETIIVCSNQHDDLSDWQRDHPPAIENCTSQLEPIGHWLLGLGDLLWVAASTPSIGPLRELMLYIAEKLRELGRQLIALASSDTAVPERAP